MNPTPADLPRVLIVNTHVFNLYTGGSIALTNYFKGWPKDKIAQVYSDNRPADHTVCDRFYELGPNEIHYCWPLSIAFRRYFSNRRPGGVQEGGPADEGFSPQKLFGWIIRALGGKALFHRVRLSPQLEEWIREFKPTLLFTQLGDLPQMDLIWEISEKFGIPISLQIPDNWLENDYRTGLFSFYLRARLRKMAMKIVKKSVLNYGISDMMGEAYEKYFGVPFITLLNPVDLSEWPAANRPLNVTPPLKIVYAGTLVANAQLETLKAVKRVLSKRHREGKPTELTIYTVPSDLARYKPVLEEEPAVKMALSPSSKDMSKIFAQADILLLPINFDRESLRYIRYSMPGKVPAYMSSGIPILVYGPPEVAPVQYALKKKWAYVVSEQSDEEFERALQKLESDNKLRQELSKTALALAADQHDAPRVREKTWRELTDASRSK